MTSDGKIEKLQELRDEIYSLTSIICRLKRGEVRICTTRAPGAPDACRVSGDFFMMLKHPDLGWVPTYGGPYDSYTLPISYEDGSWYREHYDHDEGAWTEAESIDDDWAEPAELRAELQWLKELLRLAHEHLDVHMRKTRPFNQESATAKLIAAIKEALK